MLRRCSNVAVNCSNKPTTDGTPRQCARGQANRDRDCLASLRIVRSEHCDVWWLPAPQLHPSKVKYRSRKQPYSPKQAIIGQMVARDQAACRNKARTVEFHHHVCPIRLDSRCRQIRWQATVPRWNLNGHAAAETRSREALWPGPPRSLQLQSGSRRQEVSIQIGGRLRIRSAA
jgi:hypothetical protein